MQHSPGSLLISPTTPFVQQSAALWKERAFWEARIIIAICVKTEKMHKRHNCWREISEAVGRSQEEDARGRLFTMLSNTAIQIPYKHFPLNNTTYFSPALTVVNAELHTWQTNRRISTKQMCGPHICSCSTCFSLYVIRCMPVLATGWWMDRYIATPPSCVYLFWKLIIPKSICAARLGGKPEGVRGDTEDSRRTSFHFCQLHLYWCC